MKKFQKLTLKTINKGQFLRDCEAEFDKMVKDVSKYVHTHGEASIKQTAVLSMKVVVKIETVEDLSIKGTSTVKVPTKPGSIDVALLDAEQDGTPAAYVRNTPVGDDVPGQMNMLEKGQDKPKPAADKGEAAGAQ